jgi:glyoxylase-like metal-dependent hydrolase (beta-lactamase superfamily II)
MNRIHASATSRGAARHLRIHQPHPGLFAYYDGRLPGQRFAEGPNWVDEGAISLGIATYALVEGNRALVYDTHVSADHGRAIRAHLEGQGVQDFTIVYSHWHLDHVAGTSAFGPVEVIANNRTAAHLTRHRGAIQNGSLSGPPTIDPLVLPTRTFSGGLSLTFGRHQIRLIEANIHSDDATVLWLPERGILLAGDTVEDCVTYVDEPGDLSLHGADLERLSLLAPRHVLPDHGSERIIASGGYGPGLIGATQGYVGWLQGLATDPQAAATPLRDVIGPDLDRGTLEWFAPYEAIHAQNVDRALEHFRLLPG